MTSRRIALIHAVTVAMDPVREAFAAGWPEAEIVNLLDDSLSLDRARDDDLTAEMHGRIEMLADYALRIGSEGILYTCSAFGAAIESVADRSRIPVLTPNEAMFEQALQSGSRIGMLATFPPSVAGMEEEFRSAAKRSGVNSRIQTQLVPEAMSALKAGDAARHNNLLAERVAALAGCDAIMLAHFSTSRAAQAVKSVADCPVLTSPGAAVAKLRARLQGD